MKARNGLAVLVTILLTVISVQSDFIRGNDKMTWSDAEEWCQNTYFSTLASGPSALWVERVCSLDYVDDGPTAADFCWTTDTDGTCVALWNLFGLSSLKDDIDCNTRYYPLCGEECHPTMTCFFWWGFNGEWEPMDGVTANGKPVFKRQYGGYGDTYYLWNWGSPSAWVIGEMTTTYYLWGWKWGDDLFDGANWEYWSMSGFWKYHEAEVSCSVSTDAASITFSGDGMVGPGLNGTSVGTDTIPSLPNDAANVSASPFFSLIAGAVFGAVVVVVAAITVLVKRGKQTTKPAASDHDEAHHVAELSPTDIAVAVADVIPAETQSAEAVVVVEEAVPKESEAVSAKQ